MQYAKLMLDRLPEVVMPFGKRPAVASSLFQPVECTTVWPLAIEHFNHVTPKPHDPHILATATTGAIPPFAPPFTHGWFEWIDKGCVTGVAVLSFREDAAAHILAEHIDLTVASGKPARWMQVLIPYFSITHDERVMDLEFAMIAALDAVGACIGSAFVYNGQPVASDRTVDALPVRGLRGVSLGDVSAPASCLMAMFFQALLSCRNVDKLPVEPPQGLSKKRVRKGGLPLVRYHTLRIKIPGTQRYYDPKPRDPNAMPVGLHVVRGHFKTYYAEKPLLGRATGTFYWPPAVRGSLKAGSIGKHYVETRGELP